MPDPTKASMLPPQVAPLKRGELVQPHQMLDVVSGDPEDLFYDRLALLHGANYNDPQWFDHEAVARRGSTCCQECSLGATGVLRRR